MKKIFIGFMMTAALLCMSSCSCNRENGATDFVEWNADVTAKGEGALTVAFPSGGLSVDGAGVFNVNSDSKNLLQSNALTLNAADVLAAPSDYKKAQVKFAQEAQETLDATFQVQALSGTWSVDVNLYVKQPQTGMYYIFTKHWPETPAE